MIRDYNASCREMLVEVPLLDLKSEYKKLRMELLAAVDEVLTSMQLFLGPNVQALEHEWAEYCGTAHAIGVGSGTDALHLILRACNIGPGDEVITVSWTFFATIEAIIHAGATPVLVDIDPATYCLDPSKLEAAITPRTKAIIPVHIFGHPADMDPINEIAKAHGLLVIEDACQAHGAMYKGKRAGSLGDAAAFSFYLSKNLGGYGEGGIITTTSEQIAEQVTLLRNHGHESKYAHKIVGYNARLDEIQAAMLRVKLQYLEEWNEARRQHAALYNSLLADAPVVTPAEADYARHVYHVYTIRTREREKLIRRFASEGIAYALHYQAPPHTQEACREWNLCDCSLPETERASGETIQLPMFPGMTDEQIGFVAGAVREALG
jgi:dTDP-4-amino-4,6-dideoxygalactose transaminase